MRPTEPQRATEANPIAAIRKYPFVVVLSAIVFGAAGAALAMSQPETFAARAGIVVEDVRASTLFSGRSSDAERYVANQVAVLESRVVADRASEIAARSQPPQNISTEDLLRNTSISSRGESDFITISYVAESARRAREGADAIAQAYEEVIQEALAADAEFAVVELDKAIDTTLEEIASLQVQIEGVRTQNDERVELDAQLAEIVAALVQVREESAALRQADTAADIALRVQQLTDELRGRLLVADVEARVPATSLLLRRQQDAAARLSELTLRRSQIEVDARLAGNGVAFLVPAGEGIPRGVPTLSTVVILAALGALLGAGIAYWMSQRRQYIEDRLTPQIILNAPLLAEVPSLTEQSSVVDRLLRKSSRGPEVTEPLPVIQRPASAHAEAFRVLVTALTQRLAATRDHADTHPRRGMSVAVCSPLLGDGKTFISTNLALAASRAGLKVALVDGDFATQDAFRLMYGNRDGLMYGSHDDQTTVGLTEVIRNGTPLDDAVIPTHHHAEGSVALLGRGHDDEAAPDLFGSPAAGTVIKELTDSYDLVIIDLPPLLQVAYASAAAQKADYALIAVPHRSPVDNLKELRYRLELLQTTTLGYVYTNATPRPGTTPPTSPNRHTPQPATQTD